MSKVETIIQQAVSLTEEERHELGLRLLDGDLGDADPGVDAAWGAEIASRLAALDRGEIETYDGAEVLSAARERLKTLRALSTRTSQRREHRRRGIL